MTRPSRGTDALLIEAGKQLLVEQGMAGFNLRAVARRAGVNLGMFQYHFKGKEDFYRRVRQALYDDFFRDFQLEVSQGEDSLESLRRGLVSLGRFSRDNRQLACAMVREVVSGNARVLDFLKKSIPPHAVVLVKLVRRCQKEGRLQRVPLPVAMSFLAGGVAIPHLAMAVAQKAFPKGPFGWPLRRLEKTMLSDKAIAQRVAIALKGLAP